MKERKVLKKISEKISGLNIPELIFIPDYRIFICRQTPI